MIILLTLVALPCIVTGKVYQDLGEVPKNLQAFDFIIAGGGTAGSVVASRLSEDRRFNVLLVEAGNDTAGVIELDVPAWATRRNDTEFNWRFVSERMPGLNNRTLDIPRGRGLGGSSAINGMVYARGSSDDYDNWARVSGDNRWRWNSLWPYIQRHEKFVGGVGGRNVSGDFDPEVHGYIGNVQTSLGWQESDHDLRAIRNTELQPEFPFLKDVNGGRPLGVGWIQSTIGDGERYHSAKSYLNPKVRRRPNLTILLNTHITRVLPTTGHRYPERPDVEVRTLEVGRREGGNIRVTFTALKELILSAGVIGSPWVLMNSGIGNRTELEALGITPILDLPDVGEGITEHVSVPVAWDAVPPNDPIIDEETAWAMWQQNRTGPLTQRFPHHQMLRFKLPEDAPILKEFEDPSTGDNSPNFQRALNAEATGGYVLLTPYSRGNMKLTSSDPYARPKINYNLLSHPFDIAALAEGVRTLKRFYSGPAWEGYITGFSGPDPDTLTQAEWEEYVRANAFTTLHPVGSARMSRRGEKEGVVDGDLNVKGVRGLRVVDSSVIPYVPSANTQAAVYILAERASDIIKSAW